MSDYAPEVARSSPLSLSDEVLSRKRPAPSPTPSTRSAGSVSSRKRAKASPAQSNRGLRHFSMMVCQKVEEKGTTSYNEVADELVKKVMAERFEENSDLKPGKFDEKNIRRRVYDALNVLMAMDIISKDKKAISWRGLPSVGEQDLESLTVDVERRKSQLKQKREALKELMSQQISFRNLIWLNHQRGHSEEQIPLPFIVVNTHAAAVIQCDMSRDRTNVMFDFNRPFEVNDDNSLLKKMGMDKINYSVLQEMMPEDLLAYCSEHQLLDGLVTPGRQHREAATAAAPYPPPPHYAYGTM